MCWSVLCALFPFPHSHSQYHLCTIYPCFYYLLEEGITAEISSISSGGQNDGSPGLDLDTRLVGVLVLDTNDCAVLLDQVGDAGLLDELDTVGLRDGEILDGLHECVGDGHAGHLFLATVGAREGVATETRDQGEIQLELFLQPLDSRGRPTSEDLDKIGAEHVASGLGSIVVEGFDRVLDAERCISVDDLLLVGFICLTW